MSSEKQLWYEEARSLKYLFYRQLWHLIALLILVPVTWSFVAPVLGAGSWLGVTDVTWFWLAIGMAISQQVIAWIVWRLQLGWATLSKIFGRADLLIWGLIFLPLLFARPILLFGLAYATSNSLVLPKSVTAFLALILLIPAIYTLWSVVKYFGIIRAMGADHFRIDYRHMPLVDQGAFKFSSNAMYTFAFFLLWSIALFQNSQVALGVALFQHSYIWVHYFCTEKPNMEVIYGIKN